MIEIQKKLYELFTKEKFSFGDDYIEFGYNENTNSIITELNLSSERLKHSGNEFIRIQKDSLPFLIFNGKKEFQKINVADKVRKDNKDILIFSVDEQETISLIDEIPYINFKKKDKYYYFTNIFGYVEFIDFLKSLDSEVENAFHFIDYFNKDYNKIVLTSLSEKSRIIIKYNEVIPTFTEKKDLSVKFNEFAECFEENNNQIVKFLKSSFIEYASRYEFDNRLPELYINLGKILKTAKLNFEVYINNLSIDKVKEEYFNYKTKYFNNISDILSKLTQKIIGLPIAFATTLFVINKISNNSSDNALFFYSLIFILVISTIFITSLLKIHYKDILNLYSSFSREYKALIKNNFFNKYPDEVSDFEDIKDIVNTKISILKYVIIGYYWLLNMSNLLLIYFILKKVGYDFNNLKQIYLIGVILLIIGLLLLGNILIINKRKKMKSVA